MTVVHSKVRSREPSNPAQPRTMPWSATDASDLALMRSASVDAHSGHAPFRIPMSYSQPFLSAHRDEPTSSDHKPSRFSLKPMPTLRVLQWTPQSGHEGTDVTVILDAEAINALPADASFDAPMPLHPGDLSMQPTRPPNRFFRLAFGLCEVDARYTRASVIDGNGVGQDMNAGPDERNAFVIVCCKAPPRHFMGAPGEPVLAVLRVVNEHDSVVEETILGQWGAQDRISPRTSLDSAPVMASEHLQSPARQGRIPQWTTSSPMGRSLTTVEPLHVSPKRPLTPPSRDSPEKPESAKHRRGGAQPSLQRVFSEGAAAKQPHRLGHRPRRSRIEFREELKAILEGTPGKDNLPGTKRAELAFEGTLEDMAAGWSNDEWQNRRRLVRFTRRQVDHMIHVQFAPIRQQDYEEGDKDGLVVSCIYRDEGDVCFATSVDTIQLLEFILDAKFTIEEKNRIRRNLEGFKPVTVSKSKPENESFFKLIMGFPEPKPRNIEKDVKVFLWSSLVSALSKIVSKYAAVEVDDPRSRTATPEPTTPSKSSTAEITSRTPGRTVSLRPAISLRQRSPTIKSSQSTPALAQGAFGAASPGGGSLTAPSSPRAPSYPPFNRQAGLGFSHAHGDSPVPTLAIPPLLAASRLTYSPTPTSPPSSTLFSHPGTMSSSFTTDSYRSRSDPFSPEEEQGAFPSSFADKLDSPLSYGGWSSSLPRPYHGQYTYSDALDAPSTHFGRSSSEGPPLVSRFSSYTALLPPGEGEEWLELDNGVDSMRLSAHHDGHNIMHPGDALRHVTGTSVDFDSYPTGVTQSVPTKFISRF